MFENAGYLLESIFPENNQRVINQKQRDITVIIGNPPYSAKQRSTNDNNQNLKYEKLDEKIGNTYAKFSKATFTRNLYASEIRAIKWASERINNQGIICYVINGALIDKGFADGLRKCLVDEFTTIYCFNLRGDGRTSGEQCRKEGHPLFAALGGQGGSLVPIAIILLIKNPNKNRERKVFYHDIGDYLTRKQKLSIIQGFGNISTIKWQEITPNENYDWINQRNDVFDSFISLGDKKDKTAKTIFDTYSLGIATNRDAWVFNFSQQQLTVNMTRMIAFYNEQLSQYKNACNESKTKDISIDQFTNSDPKSISWSRGLKNSFKKDMNYQYEAASNRFCSYRPYCKQWLYFNKDFNEMPGQSFKLFPNESIENLVIAVTGVGSQKDFSCLIVDSIYDLHFQHNGQGFPLYTYEKQSELGSLFATANTEQYTKKENIPDSILKEYQQKYQDTTIGKEDIFYYIYGVLHSPEYKQRFASDLKKMLPRIPFTADFWTFSKAGRELAYWHINYETIEPYELEEFKKELYLDNQDYRVEKMVFGKNKNGIDKTIIIYNSKLTLSQIPLEAYEYIVNGKSALEWIMERYKVTKDKDSGIINDPNHWSENPRYIVDLVKRIVRVSLETMRIVNSLPALNEW